MSFWWFRFSHDVVGAGSKTGVNALEIVQQLPCEKSKTLRRVDYRFAIKPNRGRVVLVGLRRASFRNGFHQSATITYHPLAPFLDALVAFLWEGLGGGRVLLRPAVAPPHLLLAHCCHCPWPNQFVCQRTGGNSLNPTTQRKLGIWSHAQFTIYGGRRTPTVEMSKICQSSLDGLVLSWRALKSCFYLCVSLVGASTFTLERGLFA